jgi:putative FmdB family regulatory protein
LEIVMPIYEYRCDDCGFQKEYLRKTSDPVLVQCPQCGKDTFKKMLTAAGFQLKGSGWYATDFKGSGAKPAAKNETKPVAGETKSGAKASTEAKPAAGETKSDAKDAGPAKSKPAAATNS